MTDTEIPNDYALSPSYGTPHLKINHEATVDLDSTTAFEGPEKLLEIWFSPSADPLEGCSRPDGLKAVPTDVWKDVLDRVNCQILSIIESEQVDAYLLSESSMFVFPHKVILKTCGTTTLLRGLQKMLEVAATYAGFQHRQGDPTTGISTAAIPYRVFYSRKKFQFPQKQMAPHRSWRDEVRCLDGYFQGGSAYMVGKMNGEHWYLYLTEPRTTLTPPTTPGRSDSPVETETKFLTIPGQAKSGKEESECQDETLEILMTDLDTENAKQFYLGHASAVAESHFFQKSHEDGSLHLQSNENTVSETNGSQARKNSATFDVFNNSFGDPNSIESDSEIPPELSTEGHALGAVVSEHCGLSSVYPRSRYPDSRIDAYLFSPCGFSANAVIPEPRDDSKKTGTGVAAHYFNVHVTPEPHCSYASFETNVPAYQTGRETADIVEHVVSIFKPARFSVTLFEAKETPAFPSSRESEAGSFDGAVTANRTGKITGTTSSADKSKPISKDPRMDKLRGYRRVERIVHDLDGYDLVFRHYVKEGWKVGAPRIGEHAF